MNLCFLVIGEKITKPEASTDREKERERESISCSSRSPSETNFSDKRRRPDRQKFVSGISGTRQFPPKDDVTGFKTTEEDRETGRNRWTAEDESRSPPKTKRDGKEVWKAVARESHAEEEDEEGERGSWERG